MDIKQVYREETNKDVYLETTGLGDCGENGSYKDEYVKWLENKVIRFEQQVRQGVSQPVLPPETLRLAKDVIGYFNYEHGDIKSRDTLLIQKFKKDGFNEIEIAKIVNAIESTCKHCYDGESGCQCWNDE